MTATAYMAAQKVSHLLSVYGIRLIGAVLILDALFQYGVTWFLPKYPHQMTFILGILTYLAGSTAMRAKRGATDE